MVVQTLRHAAESPVVSQMALPVPSSTHRAMAGLGPPYIGLHQAVQVLLTSVSMQLDGQPPLVTMALGGRLQVGFVLHAPFTIVSHPLLPQLTVGLPNPEAHFAVQRPATGTLPLHSSGQTPVPASRLLSGSPSHTFLHRPWRVVDSHLNSPSTSRHSTVGGMAPPYPVLHTPVHVPLMAVSKQLLGQAPFVRAKLGMLLHTGFSLQAPTTYVLQPFQHCTMGLPKYPALHLPLQRSPNTEPSQLAGHSPFPPSSSLSGRPSQIFLQVPSGSSAHRAP